MAKVFAHMRLIAGALALAFLVAAARRRRSWRRAARPRPPASSSSCKSCKGGVIAGEVSIPDKKAANLIHPAGRDWREFHTVTLRWIGGIAILGMLVLLIVYYMWRGTCASSSGRSGTYHSAFQRVRAFRALADRVQLRHPGDHRPQHHLRPRFDPAVAGRAGVQRLVGMGEVLA